ncbi:MAG: tRNA (adenosine(37)-N6)-threonylcarbamoyltransferase complex dimerization subunit type 1 TsaB [Acidimicrobiales bacterium]|nr:MAG: tRNA (adenosine(37)-N6)-threonylcarbamoyltransferase complex dimerization subunit type 1 TsaB [Acidimicrobiales bacterium]
MLTLALESATDVIGCALGDADGVVASMVARRPRLHAESLAPMVEMVLERANVRLAEVRVVAVDVGPGLFTGLRAGIATARSLAFALGVPMVGVRSLDLLAFAARYRGGRTVSILDARRGEVFWAEYRATPGGVQTVRAPAVARPETVVSELVASASGEGGLLVGDGVLRYRDVFAALGGFEVGDPVSSHPSVEHLVGLAHAKAEREEFVPHESIRPLYLRDPDTRIGWEVRPGIDRRAEVDGDG